MTAAALRRGLLAMLLAGSVATAHDGVVHPDQDAPAAAPSAGFGLERPQRLADGSLVVGKPMQRLLGLRTVPWSAAAPALDEQRLAAEFRARPDAALAVIAPERGRLEAPDGGWRLAGQAVAAGEVLAWLRPQLSQGERAERGARLARLDAELAIIAVNVERQQLQRAATDGRDGQPNENIWAEKYLADRDALLRNRELLAASLDDRIALRAPQAGRLLAGAASAGAVVEAGSAVLRLSDPRALQLVADHQQAGLGARIASARLEDGQPLLPAGEEPLADGSGWRLRFALPAAAGGRVPLAGELARVTVRLRPAAGRVALPPGACVLLRDGAEIWIQREPERYEARRLAACPPDPAASRALVLAEGDRIVVAGAALLSRYR